MSAISESFKTNPSDVNHIIPLDFKSLPQTPDSHTWTPSPTDPPLVDPSPLESVPIIDLTDPNAPSLIRHACEKWGIFQLINHGIPMDLFDDLELQTRRLFTLPAEQKLRAARTPDSISGYGLARISKFYPKLMWSEGFTIMGSPKEHACKLWPHDDPANFCNVMEGYQREMKDLAENILCKMVNSLGLTNECMKWLNTTNGSIDDTQPQTPLQLNSYPVCPDPTRAMGLAPHTDSSLITFVYQGQVSGLQVLRDDIGWVQVQPIKGALVANIGDLMQILSNDHFKSSMHRVVVNNTRHRISVAYFYGPPKNVKISSLSDKDHPPLYRAVTWKDYLDVKSMHYNNSLDSIRI